MRSIIEIKQLVINLASQIEAPLELLPTFDNSIEEIPNIEIGSDAYFYALRGERGASSARRTVNLNELLYWVFCDITSKMAWKQVQKQGGARTDHKLRLDCQILLLEKLNARWKERLLKEIAELEAFRQNNM